MVEKYLMLRTSKLFWYYSVYSQYSQYQYSQYRTKYCQYLAVPALQIPGKLEVQQYSTSRV